MPKPGEDSPLPPELADKIVPRTLEEPLEFRSLIPRWRRWLMRVRGWFADA